MNLDPDFKDLLKKYFTFSRREYKASLAMLAIIMPLWFFSDIKMFFFPEKFDDALITQKIAEFNLMTDSDYSAAKLYDEKNNDDSTAYYSGEDKNGHDLFSFNPNKSTDEEFNKLGFSKKQIHIIKNFIAKVGEIKSKSDFKKIYGITEQQYELLNPYIDLPETTTSKHFDSYEKKQAGARKFTIEINTADSIELDELPGIGMGYARRIIKYRSSLGGFFSIDQLMEVYGFRTTLLDSIRPYLTIDVSKVKLLNLNTATFDELRAHPYCRYKLANAIVNYRQQHGNFESIDDLKNVVLISDDVFIKIKKYLTLN